MDREAIPCPKRVDVARARPFHSRSFLLRPPMAIRDPPRRLQKQRTKHRPSLGCIETVSYFQAKFYQLPKCLSSNIIHLQYESAYTFTYQERKKTEKRSKGRS